MNTDKVKRRGPIRKGRRKGSKDIIRKADTSSLDLHCAKDYDQPPIPLRKLSWEFSQEEWHFDDRRQQVFLDMLAECGNKNRACYAAGINPETLRLRMQSDEVFASRANNAMNMHFAMLENEVLRRAVTGWEEPQRNAKGEVVGTVRKYSDRLLEFYVKRHMHEYRDKVQADVNVTGGVLVLGGTMNKQEDWETKHAIDIESDRAD